jgi:hypothetical protein
MDPIDNPSELDEVDEKMALKLNDSELSDMRNSRQFGILSIHCAQIHVEKGYRR